MDLGPSGLGDSSFASNPEPTTSDSQGSKPKRVPKPKRRNFLNDKWVKV